MLIIKKKYNNDASKVLKSMVDWFNEQDIEVMVEPDVYTELQPCKVLTWKEEVVNAFVFSPPGPIPR